MQRYGIEGFLSGRGIIDYQIPEPLVDKKSEIELHALEASKVSNGDHRATLSVRGKESYWFGLEPCASKWCF